MRAKVSGRRRRSEGWRRRSAGLAAGSLLVALTSQAAGQTGLCAAVAPADTDASVDAMLTAADALTSPLDRPRARGLYLAVLARDPDDEEAAVGLARADAQDGCLALAERGYRDVLARSPGNVDARAGLADVLVWDGRWGAAEVVLDEGITYAPLSPDLLSRRARVARLRGEPAVARRFLAEAARVAPLDPEVREAEGRVFLGQARLGQRVQLFPRAYDDLYTTDMTAAIRWRRLRFELAGQVVSRHGAARPSRSGEVRSTVIDGRPSFGAYHHFENGGWAGGSVGVSAPALALPRWSFALSGFTPLGRVLSAHLTTALWQYRDDRDVVFVTPALTAAVTDTVDVTARYWLTSVIARGADGSTEVEHVHSAGARVGWRATERLTLGLDYTYGVQLERNPTATELLDLRSHIVSALAFVLLTPSLGVDGALSVERRSSVAGGPAVLGPAAEAGVFARW
ncbi:MAG: YaiO family outer membrane beta-barrel protein [Labilithrix sp.]|nr:YaiO family outer membrane beta-barrel protein [Labilithrix sp.]